MAASPALAASGLVQDWWPRPSCDRSIYITAVLATSILDQLLPPPKRNIKDTSKLQTLTTFATTVQFAEKEICLFFLQPIENLFQEHSESFSALMNCRRLPSLQKDFARCRFPASAFLVLPSGSRTCCQLISDLQWEVIFTIMALMT